MNTDKLISSLCYFSVFFAGFILPIAVYFIVANPEVKTHAKHALISHIIPLISIPLVIIPVFFIWSFEAMAFVSILLFILVGIINIAVIVWNVIKGIKVLGED